MTEPKKVFASGTYTFDSAATDDFYLNLAHLGCLRLLMHYLNVPGNPMPRRMHFEVVEIADIVRVELHCEYEEAT